MGIMVDRVTSVDYSRLFSLFGMLFDLIFIEVHKDYEHAGRLGCKKNLS